MGPWIEMHPSDRFAVATQTTLRWAARAETRHARCWVGVTPRESTSELVALLS
jgi:hypothetical protein